MTGKTDADPTVIEQAESNPAAARELAAARLAAYIGWALNEALRARGWQAKQLAATLGVGESAVSQVLNGDGNLRVATIGRYARALGYQPRLVLDAVEPGLDAIARPAPRGGPNSRRRAGHRVGLPDSGWHLLDAADGGLWAMETTVAERAPERVVLRAECTLLSTRREERSAMPVSAAAPHSGER